MRLAKFILLVSGLSILLAACGAVQTTEVTPTAAPVTITMITNPASPMMGDMTLQFTVADDKGQPVTGADFDVIADHTDMGGMTMHGKATEQGIGVYAITANFTMSGNWKLTVQVKKDALDYKRDISLKIK
jgi:hypothetical protein